MYETLEVGANAHPEAIRAAYKRLMQRDHPDKHAGDATAERRAQQISQAFQILSDPLSRAEYDAGQHSRFAFLRMTRAVKLGAAVFAACLAVLAAVAGLYRHQEYRQRVAQQQLEQLHAIQKMHRQEDERKTQQKEAQERLKTEAQSDAQDKARRTVAVFESHRFVALKGRGPVQGFILPPVDVFIGKDSSEKTARNIASARAALRRAVVKELAQLSAGDLRTAGAEGVVSASILKVLNGSVLGKGREAKLCHREFDEYVCRGIETVIFRGSVEVVPD